MIVIMVILLGQAAYTLFADPPSTQNQSTIDVVTRTSAAAIFGYIISSNFIRKEKSNTPAAGSAPAAQAPIGFVPPAESDGGAGPDVSSAPPSFRMMPAKGAGAGTAFPPPAVSQTNMPNFIPADTAGDGSSRAQVLVVSLIGVTALLILLYLRNFKEIPDAAAPTVAQLRDFVSASVGFLISRIRGS